MKCRILYELFPPEIKQEFIKASSLKAFEKGKPYSLLLQHFTTKLLPILLKKLEALEKGAPAFPVYLYAKRYLEEIKILFTLNVEAWETFSKESGEDKKKEIYTLLDALEKRIDQFKEKAFEMVCLQFPRNYKMALEKVFTEFDRILLNPSVQLERYSEEQREVYFKNLRLSKGWIQEIGDLVVKNRAQWLTWLLGKGRSLNLSFPQRFPHSILYTFEGNIYIVLETPEHFLGIGEGKIVCRMIHLDRGDIKALVKPRIIFGLKPETEETTKKRRAAFEWAWRESNFLMRLQGQEGVIQVYERLVFEFNGIKHLFLVEEKYEDLSLQGFLLTEKLSLAMKITITRRMLKGLIHIHEKKIIHRDIKGGNVLLDLAKEDAVHCDFNLACFFGEMPFVTTAAFSPVGIAPEYAAATLTKKDEELAKATTPKIDVWGLGIILYQLFFNAIPVALESKSMDAVLKEISGLPADWIPKEFSDLPFAPLIKRMLSVDPNERPTAKEALDQFEQLARELGS